MAHVIDLDRPVSYGDEEIEQLKFDDFAWEHAKALLKAGDDPEQFTHAVSKFTGQPVKVINKLSIPDMKKVRDFLYNELEPFRQT